MKNLILAITLFGTAASYADCSDIAYSAAAGIYSEGRVTVSHVDDNPKNTVNGVSKIVTLNSTKYLVLMNNSCSEVEYVISYPYANLMPQ